jgi:hypothetical protein
MNFKNSQLFIEKPKKTELILVFFLIILSGNPAVLNHPNIDVVMALFAIGLFGYSFTRNINIVNTNFLIISFVFIGIIIVQTVNFNFFFPIKTIAGFFTRLFIGFTIIQSVKNFPYVFTKIMLWISFAGLFFHFLFLIGIDMPSFLRPFADLINSNSVGRQASFFHTYLFNYIDRTRNAGMFWEPGAFAGYLILAMVFLGLIKEQLPKKEYQKNIIVFSIALLSTKSSMGYICFPFALFFNININPAKNKIKEILLGKISFVILFLVPLLFITSIFFYNKIDFLQKKIEYSMYMALSKQGAWEKNRMGTLLFNLNYIKERPLTGWGAHPKTRFALNPEMIGQEQGMGNGMADFIVKYGFLGFGVFLFFLFRNFSKYKLNIFYPILAIFIIVLTLQGECFLGFPLYIGLMFFTDGQKNIIVCRRLRW